MANYEPFDPSFDKLVGESLQKWHVPSISFAVVDKASAHFKSYGNPIPGSKIPADENTLYHACSTTKAQLCAAWALYIASSANQAKPKSERITWRTPLASIIPDDFHLCDDQRTKAITLEDAVSHRTGMPSYDLMYGHSTVINTKTATRNMRHLPLHNELRTDFEYCNIMYVAATWALEAVTGKLLSEILRETIWEPLGMKSTYAGLPEAEKAVAGGSKILAPCHIWSKSTHDAADDDRSLTEHPQVDLTCVSGAGYIVSTAVDWSKWMQSLLGSTPTPFTPEMTAELWSPRTIVLDGSREAPIIGVVAYALGWFTAEYRGYRIHWHSGGMTGTGSFVVIVPDLQWGVSFFANGQHVSSSLKGLMFELLDARLRVPEADRTAFAECEKVYEDGQRSAKERYTGALEKLYPGQSIDTSPSASTTVDMYAGEYVHPNYGEVVLYAQKDKTGRDYLRCQIRDRIWYSNMEVYRVTSAEDAPGDWFYVTIYDAVDAVRRGARAKGRKDAAGGVKGIDIAMEGSMPETLLPFDRVDGGR